MLRNFKGIALVAICLSFCACEKELKLNLPAGEKTLVVEGEIEAGNYPGVVLTYSVGFFDVINIKSIQFAKTADVTVTDLTTNYSTKLVPLGIPFGNGGDTFYLYVPPFTPANDSIKGQIGHSYKLTINNNGIISEAVTYIPNQNVPDSVWFEPIPKDTGMNVHTVYKDPDTIGNFTKYKTQILRFDKTAGLPEDYLTNFSSTFDDAFTNGKKLPFILSMGFSKNLDLNDTSDRKKFELQTKVFKGDTVNLKFMGIDYNTYKFWETLEYSRNSTGNPFAAPTKVASNVSNAVGIWGGYGSKVVSKVVPQ